MTHHEIGYIQREGQPPLPVKKWDGENTSSALLSNVPYLMHGSVPKFLEDSVVKKEFNSSATFHEDRKKHSRPVMGPQQKYNHPVTESQIVGWHAHENLQRVSPLTGDVVRLGQPGRTYHGLKSSDVTRHADGLFATSNRLQGK